MLSNLLLKKRSMMNVDTTTTGTSNVNRRDTTTMDHCNSHHLPVGLPLKYNRSSSTSSSNSSCNSAGEIDHTTTGSTDSIADDYYCDDDDDAHHDNNNEELPQQRRPLSFYFHSPSKTTSSTTTAITNKSGSPSKDHSRYLHTATTIPSLDLPTKHRGIAATFWDDCESGISMNCRCRKATVIMITFLLAIFVAFYSNILLVIKLGSTEYYNNHNNPHLLENEPHHHHHHNLVHTVSDKISKKSRVNTAMIGDDDDPLTRSDDESTTTGIDDETTTDSVSSPNDLTSPSSSKPKKNMKKSNNSHNGHDHHDIGIQRQRTTSKRNIAKANIQDIEPTPEAMSVNASFSACLLIKDDNEILSEWIAYHYHTIQLRHLIVAVDPLSSESPTVLLAKWKLMTDLNIRLWHDEHYMPDEFMETGQAPPNFIATETDLKNSKMRTESIIEISNHRYRQRVFLSSCLRSMRAEGNSWVIHIDTDEYVVPSKLLRQMKPRYVVIPPIEQPGSVLSLIQQVVQKTARNVNYPCISMLRVLFGSVESSMEEQNAGVPEQYNATSFESLRWRYHALPHHAELHGNPKVILDVQAIPAKYFEETIVFSIHRPVREYCPKNSDLSFSNFRKQPVAVNHYLGSWERYSGRNDKRRSRDKYDLKATVNRGHDDGLRTWLSGFVDTMGADIASKLLGNQYLINTLPIEQKHNTTNFNINKRNVPSQVL